MYKISRSLEIRSKVNCSEKIQITFFPQYFEKIFGSDSKAQSSASWKQIHTLEAHIYTLLIFQQTLGGHKFCSHLVFSCPHSHSINVFFFELASGCSSFGFPLSYWWRGFFSFVEEYVVLCESSYLRVNNQMRIIRGIRISPNLFTLALDWAGI